MNFLADENIDRQIVTALRDEGYIVVSIAKKHFGELMESFSVITPMGVRIRHKKKNNAVTFNVFLNKLFH